LQQRGLSAQVQAELNCLSRAARWTSAASGKIHRGAAQRRTGEDAADLYSLKEKKEQIVQLERRVKKRRQYP